MKPAGDSRLIDKLRNLYGPSALHHSCGSDFPRRVYLWEDSEYFY